MKTKLQAFSPIEWQWLVAQLRKKAIPSLDKRTYNFPAGRLTATTRKEFIEEVFNESMVKFCEIFPSGLFANYRDMEATFMTIAGYKLMEGFARLRKDRPLLPTEMAVLISLSEAQYSQESHLELEQLELFSLVKSRLTRLKPEDAELMKRSLDGEPMEAIAKALSMNAAACRKRKQRILEKLKDELSPMLQ